MMFTRFYCVHKINSLVITLLALGFIINADAATYYVKAGSSGNGSSWSKAFGNLDSALNAARVSMSPTQIWIAAGTYMPTIKYGGVYNGNESNLKTFKLPSNVAIYGGFNGTETQLSQRNRDANPTILSGDLSGNDINTPSNTMNNKTDNSWHVLTAENVTGVILDSLIVRDGYASGPDKGTLTPDSQRNIVTLDYSHDAGGGLLARYGSKISLNNMRFEYNAADRKNATLLNPVLPGSPALACGGGAVTAEDEDTLVTISNSKFDHNSAINVGCNGGALNQQLEGAFTISSSSFTNNVADRNGGAIRAKDAEPLTISSSTFINNAAVGTTIGDESGGAIGTIDNSLTVSASYFDSNSTNTTAAGGAIFFHIPFDDGEIYTLTVKDSIFNNNEAGAIGGGAINILGFNPHPGAQANITNTLFVNNIGGDGGAVYADSIFTIISNSIFINNDALEDGGAIFGSNFGDALFGAFDLTTRPQLQISKSLFSGNSSLGGPSITPVVSFFATALSQIFSLPTANITSMTFGGGGIASEFGGNVSLSDSVLLFNTATNGYGGALLVGGTYAKTGPTQTLMNGFNAAYLTVARTVCAGNTATLGGNNNAVRDPANLGSGMNGVVLMSDGSCQ